MSFYSNGQNFSEPSTEYGGIYTVANFHVCLLLNGFHKTALLICDIPHPIRLACRNQNMRTPSIHMPIKLIVLLNLKPLRILHDARIAVMIAILTVHSR